MAVYSGDGGGGGVLKNILYPGEEFQRECNALNANKRYSHDTRRLDGKNEKKIRYFLKEIHIPTLD